MAGVLEVGEHVFWYADFWDEAGEDAYGGYELRMKSQRVPEGGSTFGLCGVRFLRRWRVRV